MKKLTQYIVLAAGLLCGLTNLYAAPNIQIVRKEYYTQLSNLENKLVAELPADAFTTDAMGRRVTKPDHPKYVEAKAKFKAEAANLRSTLKTTDTRFEEFGGVLNEAGLKNFEMANTGGVPKSVTSDMDFTARDVKAFNKLKQSLQGKTGVTVQVGDDRLYIPEWDCTIWSPSGKDVVGSSAHQAGKAKTAQASDTFSTAGGMNKTSGGKYGTVDKPGEVLANANKFAEAQGKLANVEGQVATPGNEASVRQQMNEVAHTTSKSTDKAAEWSGTKGQDPQLEGQMEAVRKGETIEETDLVNLGDPPEVKLEKLKGNIKQQRKSLAKSYQASTAANKPIVEAAQTEIATLEGQGRKQAAVNKRAELVDAHVSNIETVNEISVRDPELMAEMGGVPVKKVGGKIVHAQTGKPVSPSQAKEGILSTLKEQFLSAIRAPKSTSAPVPPNAGGGKIKVFGKVVVTGLGVAMAGLGLYDSVQSAAQRAVMEEKGTDFAGKTYLKTIFYTGWELSGIPGAIAVGHQASEDSVNEYLNDLKAGKDPSKVLTVLRAGFMGGKEMLYQATIGGILETANRGIMALNGESKHIADQEAELKRIQEKLQEMTMLKKVIAHAVLRMSKIEAKLDPENINPADPTQKHYFVVTLKNVPTWHSSSKVIWLFSDGSSSMVEIPKVVNGSARLVNAHSFKKNGAQTVRADVVINGPQSVQYSNTLLAYADVRAETRITLPERVLIMDTPGTIALQCIVVNPPKNWRVQWEFSDNTPAVVTNQVNNITHTFKQKGNYTLRVTLLDAKGVALGTDRNTIEVGDAVAKVDNTKTAGVTSKTYTTDFIGLNNEVVGQVSYYLALKTAMDGQLKSNLQRLDTGNYWNEPTPNFGTVSKWPHHEEKLKNLDQYAIIANGPVFNKQMGIKATFEHGVLHGKWEWYAEGGYGDNTKLIASGAFDRGVMVGPWTFNGNTHGFLSQTTYTYQDGWIVRMESLAETVKGSKGVVKERTVATYQPPARKGLRIVVSANSFDARQHAGVFNGEVEISRSSTKE